MKRRICVECRWGAVVVVIIFTVAVCIALSVAAVAAAAGSNGCLVAADVAAVRQIAMKGLVVGLGTPMKRPTLTALLQLDRSLTRLIANLHAVNKLSTFLCFQRVEGVQDLCSRTHQYAQLVVCVHEVAQQTMQLVIILPNVIGGPEALIHMALV